MPIMVTTSTDRYDWLSESDGSNPVALRWNPKVTRRVEWSGDVIPLDRVYPVATFGRQKRETWKVEFDMVPALDGDDEYAKLRYLIETRRQTMVADGGRQPELLYRPAVGAAFRCIVTDVTRTPRLARTNVRFSLERVT